MRRPIKPVEVIASPRLRALLSRRRNRRILVLTGNLCYLAMLSLFLLANVLAAPVLIALLLLLFALVCLHGIFLNVGTQLIAANRVRALDEREQGVWARAHHRAYRLVVSGTSVALLYLGAAMVTALPLPGSVEGWWLSAFAYWGVLVALPSDVLYWTEPDLEA